MIMTYQLPLEPAACPWTEEGQEILHERALYAAALRDFDDYELLQDVAMGQLSGGRY